MARWLIKTASIGDTANPMLKPARTSPNDGALQTGGMTSEMAERATAIQLTAPDIAWDA